MPSKARTQTKTKAKAKAKAKVKVKVKTRAAARGAAKTAAHGAPRTFHEGDVVLRLKDGVSVAANATIESGTVGTVCRVVTPGRSYKVIYDDFPLCLLAMHDSLAKAPAGTVGPDCPDGC